jgi:hypothetical protein
MSPSGELVIMGIVRVVVGRESLFMNREVIYDPVAPVSKRTRAEVPPTKNLPITTSGASTASSSVGGSASHGRRPGAARPEEVGLLEQVPSRG